MRIIAGRDGGRKLKSIDRGDVRPTTDRTKESLFNIIGPSIVGVRFLDLFAGFGGIGIEALSRGAEEVVFIERDWKNVKIINENLAMVAYEDDSQVINNDVTKALGGLTGDFDLIFMDPPYEELSLYTQTLKKVKEYNLLHPSGIVIIEHFFKDTIDLPEGYDIIKEKKYGKSGITLLKIRESEE